MTAPESKTPNVFRTAMTDDPKLNGIIMLILTSSLKAATKAGS